jgi:hypothetical protein
MAGGGGQTLNLASDTIASNTASGSAATGGNLYLSGTVISAVKNSIIAMGTAAQGGQNCAAGTLTSAGYNVEDRSQCGLTNPSDQHPTDAKLGQLGDHGGLLETVPLLEGSAAINGGNPNGCTDFSGMPIDTDERGVPRPQGARCDVGAFEFSAPTVTGTAKISGQPQVGHTLTCLLPAVQSPDGPVVRAVIWLSAAKTVGHGATYKVTGADAGHPLRCRLVAANSAASVSATSKPVPVPPAPKVTITSADVSGHEATFKFRATNATKTECALAKGPASAPFTACTSPKHYQGLGKGSYAFFVRAVGPGGTSPPAEHDFKIR